MTDLATKYLKKTVWAIIILTLFIILPGCGKVGTPQNIKADRYRCDFEIYDGENVKTTGKITADGTVTAEILSPETVRGMKIIRDTDGRFEIEFCGEKVGSHRLGGCVTAAICDIISGGKGSGSCGLGEFKTEIRADGFITDIEFSETEQTVKLTNFEYI